MTTDSHEPKLTRPRAMVDATGHAVINRAIVLRLATLASTESDDAELHGSALVAICKDWMTAESDRLRTGRKDVS